MNADKIIRLEYLKHKDITAKRLHASKLIYK